MQFVPSHALHLTDEFYVVPPGVLAGKLRPAIECVEKGEFLKALAMFDEFTAKTGDTSSNDKLPDAHFYVGLACLIGFDGIPVDEDKANEHFRKAYCLHTLNTYHNNEAPQDGHEKEFRPYMDIFNLAYLHQLGLGINKNLNLASQYYQLAGSNGNPVGYIKSAYLLATDSEHRDLNTSDQWYRYVEERVHGNEELNAMVEQGLADNQQIRQLQRTFAATCSSDESTT
jgi:hypothetical protein